jgi:hypothetical protein
MEEAERDDVCEKCTTTFLLTYLVGSNRFEHHKQEQTKTNNSV